MECDEKNGRKVGEKWANLGTNLTQQQTRNWVVPLR